MDAVFASSRAVACQWARFLRGSIFLTNHVGLDSTSPLAPAVEGEAGVPEFYDVNHPTDGRVVSRPGIEPCAFDTSSGASSNHS